MDAVAIIEAESRDSIRMRGIETGSDALEALIREVFADYEARAARGEVPTVRDPESVVSDVAARIGGFGPLQPFLDDPTVEEIWINSPTEVFVSRLGVAELTPLVLSDSQVRGLVERMLASSGRRIDLSTPFVDALLPDGSRLHAVIPHVTRQHISVNIRKFIARAHSLSDLVQLGTLTDQAARFLDAAVKAGLNILVSGSTSAGKTTTLNCLGAAVRPRERVITIEEVFELDIRVRDVVAMQTRQASLEGTGEISMRRLVKETLRMRPDRIIVGEVREAESLDMLIALNSGLPGMASIHANSARDAIGKLCTLPLLAGENVAGGFVIPTVASAIDLVVHQDLMPDGRRRIREIAAVPGRVEEGVVEIEKIFETRAGRLIRADGFPPHRDRFARAGHDLGELLGAA
ncbi:Flp pilus assembly complex ATPase component TadA [Helcobacillus sp. ACRRO]|uniref:CpaF family protein n=1 Tax=Helcobacillus sp. ACRRO TaxID=2918202 RepID=UPI001EF51B4E|nr:Flp pilus assembly complex ATPase component TadA [Helcobacillus sp. ACRRO]